MSWLLDAQNGSKLSTDNDQVVCSSSLIETPINALYESIVIASPGRYFIEFECDRVQESLFVGLTTKPAFKPGWNNKGTQTNCFHFDLEYSSSFSLFYSPIDQSSISFRWQSVERKLPFGRQFWQYHL